MLQSNEVGHVDIRMQSLTSDEDGECKVAAAGPSVVKELSDEVSESMSRSVDVINLPSEPVASPAGNVELLTTYDEDESLHSEVKSESLENVAAVEDQHGSEVVCDETFTADDDDVERHRTLDDTVTNVVISEDVIVGGATVNSASSATEHQLETNSVDEATLCDSDVLVKDDQPGPTESVSNIALSSPQIESVGKDVSERQQLQNGDSASDDLHGLPDDSVTMDTERENVARLSESGGLSSVEEDIGTHSSFTEAQLVGMGNIMATGHADLAGDKVVDEVSETSPGSDQPCTIPESEMVESKKLAVSLPESVMAESKKLADGFLADGLPESVMAESKKLVDGLPADGLPECWSEGAADKFEEVCDVIGGGDGVLVDEDASLGDVGPQLEHDDDDDDDDDDKCEPVSCETDVVSPADVDISVAESDTRLSISSEPAAQLEHDNIDDNEPLSSESTKRADMVSSADVSVADTDSQPSISVGTDAETAAQSELNADIVRPVCDIDADTDVVSSAGDDMAGDQTGSLLSKSVDKSRNDAVNDIQESVAGQEGLNEERSQDDTCETGDDWLDTVVNVSQVSFVNKDDIPDEPCTDVGKQQQTDDVAVTVAVANDSDDGISARAAETNIETVAVADADNAGSGQAVETGVEKVAPSTDNVSAASTAMETGLEIVTVVDSNTGKDKSEIGKPIKPIASQENSENSTNKVDTVDSAYIARIDRKEPAGKEVVSQQLETDVDATRTEKSRLYSKNVVIPDTPAVGPAACLAADVKDPSKAGTPLPLPEVKVTSDQPSGDEPVVMRRKSPAEPASTDNKENETSKVQRV